MSLVDPEEGSFRRLTGISNLMQKVLLVAIPIVGILFILDINLYLGQILYVEQYLSIFLGLVLASIFLMAPANKSAYKHQPPWYDVVLAVIGLSIGIFLAIVYPEQIFVGVPHKGLEFFVLGILDVLLVIEAARRMTGWILVALVVISIFYAHFAYIMPSPFFSKGVPWDQLLLYLFLDNNALLGMPLSMAGSILFTFILFGVFLAATGSGKILNDFATASLGRFRGGPAKMAVVGSSLFGTISGSAVANVAAVGVVTIPLMKSIGYKPHTAGGIEAAASTGGQLMPPVMGVTAFLIAEFLRIPYREVVIAAILPAVLYYFSIFIQVDVEAAKQGMKGTASGVQPISSILLRSWVFVIPIVVLVYTLFALNWQPAKSALAATVAIFVLGLVSGKTRMGPRALIDALESTGKGMLMIGALTGLAGLLIGVFYITGVGTTLSFIMLQLGGKNLLLVLILTAMLCIILGMGLPTAACYIILAVLAAPALIELGVYPLGAHFFIFYFGLMAMVTPPVAVAAYAAAAIANANPNQTGWAAVRFSIVAYIVPFIFVYSPALLLRGSLTEILFVGAKTTIGIWLVAIALSGFLFKNLSLIKRILIALGALALLFPSGTTVAINTSLLAIAGLILVIPILFIEWCKVRQRHELSTVDSA